MKTLYHLKKILISESFFAYFFRFFWVSLLLILIFKAYLILPANLNNDTFLYYYKFLVPDSYDWIINAKYFEDLGSTSVRQPGFTLLVKLFLSLNSLWMIIVLNQLVFIGILFFVYEIITRLTNNNLKTKYLTLFFLLIIYQNNYLQIFSNYFLSDLYAIFFYSSSLVLLLRGYKKFSAILLGISWLFQNFSPILLPIFLVYIFLNQNREIKFDKTIFKSLRATLEYLLLFLLPNLPWLIYRFILFGNPFFTKVLQFELVIPNGNSIFYYSFNGTSIFGILFIPIIVILTIKVFENRLDRNSLLLTSLLITSLIFWVIVYEWNDRRFLLYLIPFILPLSFKMIFDLKIRTATKYFLILLFFINTTVYTPQAKLGNTLALTHWESLEVSYPSINLQGINEIKPRIIRQNPPLKSLIFPNLYFTYVYRSFYRSDPDSRFARYRRYIENNYDRVTKTLCHDPAKFIYESYDFNNILRYVTEDKIEDVKVTSDCTVNL